MAPPKTSAIEDIYIRVGARIAELRLERGLTQDELGRLRQLSPNYIARTEGAYHRTNLPKLGAVADALAVSLAELLRTALPPIEHRAPHGAARVLASLGKDDLQLVLQLARHLQRLRESPRGKRHHKPSA